MRNKHRINFVFHMLISEFADFFGNVKFLTFEQITTDIYCASRIILVWQNAASCVILHREKVKRKGRALCFLGLLEARLLDRVKCRGY